MSVTRSQNEAFSRVLIDKALEASGWNLLDPRQVQFELNTATPFKNLINLLEGLDFPYRLRPLP